MTITITIPDLILNRVLSSFDSTGGASVSQQNQMLQDSITSFILDRVSVFESQKAVVTAAKTAVDKVKKDIQLQTTIAII